MASWIIYGSNNVAKATVKELELHDEWMAECYLTISVKSATPIAFAVGDYIDYRGERYTIQYDPNVIKKATSGSYGEGFTYDNIKFVGLQDEVVRCDFNDIVLNDNDIHYSALPTFPFYCESVDDLLDRIQANLEDLYPGQWIIIGLNTVRNAQRGTAVGRAQAFLNAYKQYIDPTGAANTDPYGKQGVAETADNITCWDAMKKVHDDFDLNFIVRGRVIIVGTAGVFTANTFRYGKGNGLYELERIGESDQRIVTRLRAYGSEQNLPAHYYNTINKQVYATVTSILHKFDTTGADFLLDLDFDRKYFTYRSESYPGTTEAPNYIIEMMANDVTVRGYVTKDATTGKCYVYCESVAGDDDRDEPDASKMAAFVQALTANDRLDFVEYVNKDAFGEGHYDYGTGHLPDNMAVSRLMLPGFPTMSLHAWVQAHKDDADKAWLAQAVVDGFTFSNEVYRPYIDSPNKTQYGVRPGSIYFDGSDDTEDVHPTIEGMTYNGAPIDEVYAADQVADNGVYPAGEEVKNIKITLPVLGFELDKVYEDGASIDMKNGMCGARSFKMAGTPKKDANGRWVCTVERVHDDALDLWFPYCDFQIHGSSEAGRQHGDNYVLTGIDMPAAYIEAASVRLLQESIEALKKNHAPRYTYQPRIDELWMQRQHDTAISSQGVVSLHDTLKAGDIFAFADTDLNIDANVIIDVLTIRENGNNGIPTYEVTLRDEKQVGTIQKITNKVDSIISGATAVNGATGGGLTARQVQSLIDRFGGEQFLSKLNDDTAAGYITMLKGLQIGASFVPDILGEGGVLRMRQDGKVELVTDILYARMKAYFDTVEVREYQHTGGNRIASVAGNRICRVEWYNSSNQVLEQTQANLSSVAYFRCYFRASDGEDTVRNNWVVGDMAYCHVTSIANSSDNPEAKGANQKHLWRLVIGRNADNVLTEDGEGYIDLSNRSTETISSESYAGYQSGSDTPAAQDDIIQLGNVNDTTRQGAIVEFVTGTDAPSYQIYQGIGQKVGSDASSIYSLTSKNQITIGYNTATGKADMKVYGDAYIGARDRSTFIEYKQDDGTQQHAPVLNIKAKVQTLPNSTYEGKTASQFVQDNQIKYDQAIQNLTNVTNDLQSQIDGEIVSWFYEGTPTLSNAPAVDWNTDVLKERHLGDMYYDVGTGLTSGFAYRFIKTADEVEEGEPQTYTYSWQYIDDTAITLALAKAAEALNLANTKTKTYTTAANTLPSAPYNVGDLWLNATGTWGTGASAVTWDNEILKCITACPSGSAPDISHWAKASKYTDDSAFNGYISALLNGTGASGDSATAAAIQKAVVNALGSALGSVSLVTGGLMLTSLIGMRQLNSGGDPSQISDYTTWGGISGEYNQNDETVSGGAKGHGIAAWYGGDMVDKQMLSDADIDAGWGATLPDESTNYRWARSLFRFDGSGYIADANIYWDKVGSMTIKNLQTIYGTQQGVSVDINTLSSLTSIFNTETKAGTGFTELLVQPQNAFSRLYLNRGAAVASYPSDGSINDYAVLNFGEMKSRFVTKDFFSRLFQAFNGSTAVNVNDLTTTIDNIKAMVDFWSQGGITALGQGSQGGGGGASALYQLTDVSKNAAGDGVLGAADGYVLTYNASTNHWYAAPTAETYVLPQATSGALGGIKIGYNDATPKTYAVALNSAGQAYVAVPWTDTVYTLPVASSAALGGIMIGYNGTTPKTYAVQLDANNKAYVAVNWDNAPTDYWHTGDSRTANTVLAAPNGSNGAATFRALVAADIPNLGAGKITSGTFDAARIPDLSGTYAAVSRVSTLEGYFNSGAARKADKLTTARSLWGNSFDGTADITSSIIISTPKTGESDKYIKIGDIYIGYDATNDAIEVYKLNSSNNHVAADFYARGGVSALGAGSSGGGGGGQGDVTWALLADNTDTRQIAPSHLSLALFDYATQTWVQQQGYATSSGVTSVATGTGLTGGTITSSGTISINSTYQTYISHGESAYNSLGNYLPLSGGTIVKDTNDDIPLRLQSGGSQADCYLGYNNYAGTLLGYIGYSNDAKPILYYNAGEYEIWHKGNLTNNNQLTNGAGYITSSGSCAYATSAGKANYLSTYSADGNDNLSCLQSVFDSIPKSVATAIRLQHGSHSMAIGWFLSGYGYSNGYGGWFISDYGTPSWVGLDGGSWFACSFITSANWSSYIGTSDAYVGHASYATTAGSIAWGNVSGRPTALSSFTNDSGYITSSGSCAYATSADSATYARNLSGVNASDQLNMTSPNWSGFAINYDSGGNGKYPIRFYDGEYNEIVRFTGSGAVGIGTSSPSYKLDVNGVINGTSVYYNGNACIHAGNIGSQYVHYATYSSYDTSGNTLISSGNIGSQSVNYASSAGNADTVDNAHLYEWTCPSSPRDFVDGTLIRTDIDYSHREGDAFYMEITADTYGVSGSMKTLVQGYIYNDTIICYSVNNLGRASIEELYAMNIGGNLCFWFPRLGYWQSFGVYVYKSGRGDYWTNRATEVVNSSKPSGTKEVNLCNVCYSNAFVDSNVASATKLQTSRSIWGQSFDGTADVNGSLYLSGYLYMNHGGTWYSTIDNDGNGPIFGYGQSTNSRCAYYTGNPVYITGYYGNYATGITVTYANYVGIGTDSPSYKLDVNGETHINGNLRFATGSAGLYGLSATTTGYWHLDILTEGAIRMSIMDSGNVGIGTTSPSYKLHVSGDIYATGGVTCASDARMKDVISPTDLRVEQVADAPSVKFLWKKDHSLGMQVGTIAQYWQKVLPEAVSDKSGELSLSYGVAAIVAVITTAKKVVDHEKRISELEKECERLKTENEQLKMMIA